MRRQNENNWNKTVEGEMEDGRELRMTVKGNGRKEMKELERGSNGNQLGNIGNKNKIVIHADGGRNRKRKDNLFVRI